MFRRHFLSKRPTSPRRRSSERERANTTTPTSQKLPWPLDAIRGSMDTMRSSGEGRDVPDHAYSPLFTSGLHPSHLSPISPTRPSISREKPTRPPRPSRSNTPTSTTQSYTPLLGDVTLSQTSSTGGGPLTFIGSPSNIPIPNPNPNPNPKPTISQQPQPQPQPSSKPVHIPSEPVRFSTKHQRKRRSSCGVVSQVKNGSSSLGSPGKLRIKEREREREWERDEGMGVEFGKKDQEWSGWESGVWMMSEMEGVCEHGQSSLFEEVMTVTCDIPTSQSYLPTHTRSDVLPIPSSRNPDDGDSPIKKKQSLTKSASSPFLPFRLKSLLSRSNSTLIRNSKDETETEEILKDIIIIERKSTALENPTPTYRSSIDNVRGQSVDLERLNKRLELERNLSTRSSFGPLVKTRLEILDNRKVESLSPLRPMSRSSMSNGRLSVTPLKQIQKKEDESMDVIDEITSMASMCTTPPSVGFDQQQSSAVASPSPSSPSSSPISPTSSVRTFGHHMNSRVATTPPSASTPTFKLTRPEETVEEIDDSSIVPPQCTSQDDQNFPARLRTQSGAFEYQTFESGMEEEDSIEIRKQVSRHALRDERVTGSPASIIKKTRARPESGLMPLQLGNRSPLTDKSNRGSQMSLMTTTTTTTPPRSAGIKIPTKYSPYHLSPPAPLKIGTRKVSTSSLASSTRGSEAMMRIARPEESRMVDWGLDDEFASLEIAMDFGDE